MYLSVILVALGTTFLLDSGYFLLLSVLPMFLYCHLYVIPSEERALQDLFGAEYVRWKARVPKWFGWF